MYVPVTRSGGWEPRIPRPLSRWLVSTWCPLGHSPEDAAGRVTGGGAMFKLKGFVHRDGVAEAWWQVLAAVVAEDLALSRGGEAVPRVARTGSGSCRWPPPRMFAMHPAPTTCPMLESSTSRSRRTSWRGRPWPSSSSPQTWSAFATLGRRQHELVHVPPLPKRREQGRWATMPEWLIVAMRWPPPTSRQ